jgi:hypothetical protein
MSQGLLMTIIYVKSKRRYFRSMIFDVNVQHKPAKKFICLFAP